MGFFKDKIPSEQSNDSATETKRRAMKVIAHDLDELWRSVEHYVSPERRAEMALLIHEMYEVADLATHCDAQTRCAKEGE